MLIPYTRRCRFIAHTADLSALRGIHAIPMYWSIFIIAPCVTLSIAQLKHATGTMQTTFTTAFTSVL